MFPSGFIQDRYVSRGDRFKGHRPTTVYPWIGYVNKPMSFTSSKSSMQQKKGSQRTQQQQPCSNHEFLKGGGGRGCPCERRKRKALSQSDTGKRVFCRHPRLRYTCILQTAGGRPTLCVLQRNNIPVLC